MFGFLLKWFDFKIMLREKFEAYKEEKRLAEEKSRIEALERAKWKKYHELQEKTPFSRTNRKKNQLIDDFVKKFFSVEISRIFQSEQHIVLINVNGDKLKCWWTPTCKSLIGSSFEYIHEGVYTKVADEDEAPSGYLIHYMIHMIKQNENKKVDAQCVHIGSFDIRLVTEDGVKVYGRTFRCVEVKGRGLCLINNSI